MDYCLCLATCVPPSHHASPLSTAHRRHPVLFLPHAQSLHGIILDNNPYAMNSTRSVFVHICHSQECLPSRSTSETQDLHNPLLVVVVRRGVASNSLLGCLKTSFVAHLMVEMEYRATNWRGDSPVPHQANVNAHHNASRRLGAFDSSRSFPAEPAVIVEVRGQARNGFIITYLSVSRLVWRLEWMRGSRP